MLMGIRPGDRVDGRYELGERLGKGTYGEVWRAQEWLGGDYIGDVALKLCEAEQADLRQRLIREAQAMAQLAHPHLVAYRGCGLLEDRLFYLVMELADTSLEALLRGHGAQPLDLVTRCIAHAAEGLAHIHSRGAVHRDVKPANLLRVGGQWKLGDMGLARAVSGQMQTASGAWGTPIYMSPEQAAGQIGPASDVYALGVTAQEALTGVLPYSASTPLELATKIVSTPPTIAPSLPSPWSDLIPRMLSRRPDDRPRASEAAEALSGGARVAVGTSGPSAEEQFRRLARMAVADGRVSDDERRRLEEAARDLGLSAEQATRIAREEQDQQRGAHRVTPGSGQASGARVVAPPPAPRVEPPKPASPAAGWTYDLSKAAHPPPEGVTFPDGAYANAKDGSILVPIPAGEAVFGGRPQFRASLPGYYMAAHRVTNTQYAAFLTASSPGEADLSSWVLLDRDCFVRRSGSGYEAYGGRPDHPVVQISWYGAVAFCEWAGLSLPTELQWEKGARGTDGREYPWGNGWDESRCRNGGWTGGERTCGIWEYGSGRAPQGLYHMSGNVMEWCADWYDGEAYKRYGRGDLTPPSSGNRRVSRGGSWYYDASSCRTAYRYYDDPSNRSNYYGFRVARAL